MVIVKFVAINKTYTSTADSVTSDKGTGGSGIGSTAGLVCSIVC